MLYEVITRYLFSEADWAWLDQAQNTCIFSTEFAMRMMGDIQQYFVEHGVRNFYSVSISGYQQVTDPAVQAKFEAAWGVPLSSQSYNFV